MLSKKELEVFKSKHNLMAKEQLKIDIYQAINDSENDRLIKASDLKSKYKKIYYRTKS